MLTRRFRAIGVAVALAFIAIGVYRNEHHGGRSAPSTAVLTAKRQIRKGTTGDTVRASHLYMVMRFPKDRVEHGAIVDPAALAGNVALTDIRRGQQLTASNFGPAGRRR